MFEHLLEWLTAFNAYAKANPILAGAMSLWGLGMVTWLCKGVPLRIWTVLKRQCTTSLSFTSDSGNGTGLETFANFMRWFEGTRWARYSRSLSIVGTHGGCGRPAFVGERQRDEDDPGTVVGVGEGRHFFLYRGWPFWLQHSRVKEGNQREITYEVRITGLGRNRQRVLDLVEEFRYRPDSTRLGVYTWRYDGWHRTREVPKRPLSTVIVDAGMRDELVTNIRRWLDNRGWYEERGLPYKLTCILKGLPGTGKTSLIKALASHFRMNVCLLNLSVMTDSSFESALSDAADSSIIVIEDFDSAHAVRERKTLRARPRDAMATKAAEDQDDTIAGLLQGGLTLSGILNALDGVVALDGKIVFLTTNVYEAIDPALLRKGRVDFTYELGPLGDAEVRDYIRLMFPAASLPSASRFAPILGCDLQSLYFDHREDAAAFIAAIPQQHPTPTEIAA